MLFRWFIFELEKQYEKLKKIPFCNGSRILLWKILRKACENCIKIKLIFNKYPSTNSLKRSLKLNEPFSPEIELGTDDTKRIEINRAIVESLIDSKKPQSNKIESLSDSKKPQSKEKELFTYTYTTIKDLNRVNIPDPTFKVVPASGTSEN